jgi:hypothetical protein
VELADLGGIFCYLHGFHRLRNYINENRLFNQSRDSFGASGNYYGYRPPAQMVAGKREVE